MRGTGGDVVDGTHLCHALAVALLALGKTRGELVGRRGGRLGGLFPERVGAHDDALAVGRDHEHVGLIDLRAGSRRVELLDVGGAPCREVLHLALAHVLAGRPLERRGSLLEGSPRRLDRREAAQPVGVSLGGQVQQGICWMKVRVTAVAIREAFDVDGAKDRRERAAVTGFDRSMRDAVGIDHALDAHLVDGPKGEVVLEHPAQELAATDIQLVLELSMCERRCLRPLEPADHLLCALAGGAEVLHRRRAHLRPPLRLRSAAIPARAALSSSFLADS